jgi:glycine betaine/proline transport system ATP-binding protein
MDEAFSALDPLIRAEMQDELLRLQSIKRRTIVFITHDLDEAMRIGDRIAIMDAGQIIQTGTPEDILKNPANDYVASFFRGVDTANILTAKDIATKSQVMVIRDEQQKLSVILEKLMKANSPFSFVLDPENNLIGMVSERSLKQAIAENPDQGIAEAAIPEIETLHEDTSLRNLIGVVTNSTYGVPVTNQSNKYVGCITKTSLLNTLNQRLEKKDG